MDSSLVFLPDYSRPSLVPVSVRLLQQSGYPARLVSWRVQVEQR